MRTCLPFQGEKIIKYGIIKVRKIISGTLLKDFVIICSIKSYLINTNHPKIIVYFFDHEGGVFMTMSQFAEHAIAVSNNSVGGITNLELQKVLYFAIGEYILDHGIDEVVREVYDEPFEAWPYGPVVRSEYFANRNFGRFRIRRDVEPNENYEAFNDYIIDNASRNVTDLVNESHRHGTWLNNREAILQHQTVTYSLEDIENDFIINV